MRIDVTMDDIMFGQRGKCQHCPIARAIRRATGKLGFAVFPYRVCNAQLRTIARLPFEATVFISAYDLEMTVEPFSFDIDLPV